MTNKVLKFQNSIVERQPGELARLRVLGGPDNGLVFVLTAHSITVGRGEDNDIVLTDLKVSRQHLEITLTEGAASVRDAGSAHGTAVNGVKQAKALLKTRDKVGLGETVLEFIGAEVGATQVMTRPPAISAPRVGEGHGLTKFIPSPGGKASALGFNQKTGSINSAASGQQGTFLERNKKIVFMLAGLMALAILLPEAEKEHNKRKNNAYEKPIELQLGRDLSSLNPPKVDLKTRKASDLYFEKGFREYRARNYGRAIVAFETALQINSHHVLAKIYLEKTKTDMESEAKLLINSGKRDENSLRYRSALIKYDAVRRLYLKEQMNALFKEADTQYKDLEEKMKKQALEE